VQKNWTAQNMQLVYLSLQTVNIRLNNMLRSRVSGVLFTMRNQNSTEGQYHGETHDDGSSIDFYTLGDDAIRKMNIFHEVGHLINCVQGLDDVFSDAVTNEGSPPWIADGYVNVDVLISEDILTDPNYDRVQAKQAYNNPGSREVWADAFANYMVGNIDLGRYEGRAMSTFVTGVLDRYIRNP